MIIYQINIMDFINTPFEGAYIIEIKTFKDERGQFARTFCQTEFSIIGLTKPIVQVNHSMTYVKGTVRGMHYQIQPSAETKIIRCLQGCVFDVMIDLRKNSKTFLHWFGIEITKENMKMVYIPEGFAHGFQSMTDNVELLYFHTEFYNKELERGLRFDDQALKITWPLSVSMVSSKDLSHPCVDHNFNGL
jgi:dTDP-4-dehydrorhamnose 3,5-epimerase